MNANIPTKTIEMNKTEAKLAGIYNSEKFNELRNLQAAFPGYNIVVKAASKSKENMKGLTIARMMKFINQKIEKCEENSAERNAQEKNRCELNKLRGLNEDGTENEMGTPRSYGEIKTWFLSCYPEIDNLVRNNDKIIDEAKKIRAARKAA